MTVIYPIPEFLPDPRARFIQIANTCYALAKMGIEVTLISGMKRGQSEEVLGFYGIPKHSKLKIKRLPVLRKEYSRYFRLSWHGVFHIFLLIYLLSWKLNKKTQTVIFLRHLKLANFVLRFRKVLNIPIVFEVHEIFHLSSLNGEKKEKIKSLEYEVYNRVDALISISQSIEKYLMRMGISIKSVHIVRDAVKKEWLDLKRMPLGSYIVYTGSLYSWKGVDTLISAMRYLPDEKLLIIGSGNRLEELKNMANTEGISDRIKFIGSVPHTSIPQYLSQARHAVVPNIPDGPSQFSSPLKLFEYMAYGIPIVASNIPSFKEILTDRRNALLFEPGNPKALAMAIKELADNPELAEKLAITARKDVINYTYDKRAEKIFGVIRTLFNGN